MTPEQFLLELGRRLPAPAYLFLGPEAYYRDVCRRALLDRVLPPEEREEGFVRHSLDEVSLAAALDDACSFSLFAPRRLIWVSRAELALPRGRAAVEDEDAAGGDRDGSGPLLEAYLANPPQGVVLVFDCSRYDFQGEDKVKLERVRKFYAGIAAQVEFPRLPASQARRLAVEIAGKAGLKIDGPALDLLVEAMGADAARVAVEIEKLRLRAGAGGRVTVDEVTELVPDARTTTVFALVGALGRRDRAASLAALDTLVRQGEYLPLALTFLATQFRLALAAREAKLRTPQQIQSHFTSLGMPMWRSRAEQVADTVASFSEARLQLGLRRIFRTDKALRDARPDDRIVMEQFILRLTA